MSKKNWFRLIGYVLALAAALYYPVNKILGFEYPKIPPETYLFRAVVYDPYDPMRGRYVQLNLEANNGIRIPKTESAVISQRKTCYAILEKNPDGIAVITDIVANVKSVPKGKHFIESKYLYYSKDWDSKNRKQKTTGAHHIRLPFDRFYMNEKLAPEAERIVQRYVRQKNAVLLKVNVYADGSAAVDDLLVQGKSIRDRIREK